jgi:prephenate dehydrogenase
MRIVILGAGNMGTWFASYLKEQHKVGIYDQKKEAS